MVGFVEDASAQQLGRLSDKREKVTKSFAGQQPIDMEKKDPVLADMQAETGKLSAAKFAIGPAQGAVTMGPESRFKFKAARFDARGLLTDLDFEIQWGRFRFAMVPPLKDATKVLDQPVGIVRIKTPGGPIELRGTDVYLYVTRDGTTTVYVEEGMVEVGEAGVQVNAGQWTNFGPGLAPTPPVKADGRGGTAFPPSNELDLPSPLFLDLQSIRFDLPK